jgi:hypothetical protein
MVADDNWFVLHLFNLESNFLSDFGNNWLLDDSLSLGEVNGLLDLLCFVLRSQKLLGVELFGLVEAFVVFHLDIFQGKRIEV